MENLAGILAFIETASQGSFAKAAVALGISPPAVSRNVQRLERQLGVRLLNRTTRRLALTDEGALYFEQCQPAIERLQSAGSRLRDVRSAPAGRLRVSATVGFGRRVVAPLLPSFLKRYPEVELDFSLSDHFADLVEDRVDIAIRNGRFDDSSIVARQLAPMRLVVCGSPAYFRRHPRPLVPEELAGHRCINFRLAETGSLFSWEFERAGKPLRLRVGGNLVMDDPESICRAAEEGAGLAQLGTYLAAPLIRVGRLVPVLLDYVARDRGHYLCYRTRQHLPLRIRVFADFLAAAIDPADFELAGLTGE